VGSGHLGHYKPSLWLDKYWRLSKDYEYLPKENVCIKVRDSGTFKQFQDFEFETAETIIYYWQFGIGEFTQEIKTNDYDGI
jgi:hypothetical protein